MMSSQSVSPREGAELALTGIALSLFLRNHQKALATKLVAVLRASVDCPYITGREGRRWWVHHWPELGDQGLT